MRRLLLTVLVCAGCAGGRHRQGSREASVIVHTGIPTETDVFNQTPEGSAENYGVSVAGHWYVRDGVALTAALTPALIYEQSDGTVYALEGQIGPRFHVWESDRAGLFVDVLVGFGYFSKSVPEEGTPYNFTYEAGPGFEYELSVSTRVQIGVRYRHLSNGRGTVESNPSQNDVRIWFGFAFDW